MMKLEAIQSAITVRNSGERRACAKWALKEMTVYGSAAAGHLDEQMTHPEV